MKKFAKILVLTFVAGSLMCTSCARRNACKQAPTTVPSYVQTGK